MGKHKGRLSEKQQDYLRQKFGDRLCLVGNIDVTRILTHASRQEVEASVRDAIEKSKGGGFILAPAQTHSEINVRNVRWMLEEARSGIRMMPL